MSNLKKQIIESAHEYQETFSIPMLRVSDYKSFIDCGDRLAFEKSYFERRRQLSVLALAVFLGEKMVEELEQIIWEICNEYSWSLPAHLPIVDGVYRNDSITWIDLFAAETGQTLAEIKYILGDKLSPMLQNRIDYEIERRLIVPFETKEWEWETLENNWSAVIGGCLGMVLLYQLPEKSTRQLLLLQRIDRCLGFYLKSFGNDGACEEGIGYWAYGFGYYIYFAKLYYDIFNENKYLSGDKVKSIASFPQFVMIDEQNGIPFSDYFPSELPSGLLSFCNDYYKIDTLNISKESELDFDHCYRFAHIYRNLEWTVINHNREKSAYKYFEDVEWGIRLSPNELVFAAKGGSNVESHNHIDVGHFIFGTSEELFLTDLGAGEYTKDYFNGKLRYNYLNPSALAHSIPIINHKYQLNGDVQATNTSFHFDKSNNVYKFEANLSDTYPCESELSNFNRKVMFDEAAFEVRLQDTFLMESESINNEIIENFITTQHVKIDKNTVYLYGESNICKLEFDNSVVSIKQEEKEYHQHNGNSSIATIIRAHYIMNLEKTIKVKINIKKEDEY